MQVPCYRYTGESGSLSASRCVSLCEFRDDKPGRAAKQVEVIVIRDGSYP